jgi:hypothetical protein
MLKNQNNKTNNVILNYSQNTILIKHLEYTIFMQDIGNSYYRILGRLRI